MALMFLNGDGMRGGRAHYTIEGVPLVGERRTAPLYRFFSVRDEFPALYPAAAGGPDRGADRRQPSPDRPSPPPPAAFVHIRCHSFHSAHDWVSQHP